MSLKDNQSDLKLTLLQIHNGGPSALLKQLMELRKFEVKRERSERWAENLRFLDIGNRTISGEDFTFEPHRKRRRLSKGRPYVAPQDDARPLCTVPLTRKRPVTPQLKYIAVS